MTQEFIEMEEALQLLQAKDTKERMAGVERLQSILEQSRKALTATEVASLVDASLSLLKDNNFRVCQGALQALASAAALANEHLKLHFNVLLPAIVERLGDNKQPVRDAGRRVLLALMEISSPTIVVERAGNYAWTHKNWRVREEFARTVASAINLFAATEVPFQRLLLPSVLQLLEDSNSNAREAAMACLEEMYRQGASQLHEELQRYSLRPAQLKEITSRFEKINPKVHGFDGAVRFVFSEAKSSSNSSAGSNQRSSPKIKPAALDNNSSAGDSDTVEKPVDPVRVLSDKELTKELEKVAGVLTPEQDWSVRMAALRRIEGLIFGGAAEYACFPSLVKQLIRPLCLQLSDRRSSIVKQACHLLCLLSKELLADFESCAEAFIPVLFKLVVITVLVIAESADTCIKTMLRNCKVARVLPRIVDSAKNDRCSVLRVRCCEYALLVLEQWADSPEIQRAADLYEDLIKCCVGDAMSEVRSTARMCYRIFSRCWPERARQLYGNFDPVIQRVINEEEGGIHRRYVSPSLSERGSQQVKQSVNLPMHPASGGEQSLSFGASPIVAMDHSTSLLSGVSSATTGNLLMAQRKPAERASERSLESVLQASQQSVNAIETMLKGMDVSEKGNIPSAIRSVQKNAGESYKNIYASSYTVHGGIDPPSARDPPQPAVPVFNQSCSRTTTTSTNLKGSSGGAALLSKVGIPVVTPPLAGPEVGRCGKSANSIPLFSNPAKRIPVFSEKSNQNSSNDDESEGKSLKRPQQVEKSGLDMVFKEFSHRDVSYHSVPGFQRPLLRTSSSARSSASSRGIIDDSQLLLGEGRSCMDGLMSLNDALAEGLSSTADWSARVAAFSYLRALLQQGSRGVQEVVQCFEKVMKLFCQHLDDPHHKVAQAALTTLSDLIPLCRKPFETYLERILPHVFLRLVDPKEIIRQLSTSILDMVGHSYTIDSLLPALLRSLDEQRSPKAKIAVIEFAIASFARLGMNGEIAGGNNLLRVWLAKLAPLANDKNAKLKETAVHGLISVYSHYDSTAVLNFIIGLAIQEQSTLRRALKQYTPRIEADLVKFFQSKGQRTRTKPQCDQHDSSGAVLENDYGTSSARRNASQKAPLVGSYSSGSLNSDSGIKPAVQTNVYERHKVYYKSFDDAGVMDDSPYFDKPSGHQNSINSSPDRTDNWSDQSLSTTRLSLEAQHPFKSSVSPKEKVLTDIEQCIIDAVDGMDSRELQFNDEKHEKAIFPKQNKKIPLEGKCLDIPALLHQLCSGSDEKLQTKREALEEFMQLSCKNDTAMWSQYVNQILTSVLEILDDSDTTVRELALSTLSKMLSNQKEILEDSVEVLLEKLLHSVKDIVAKVSCAADQCLSTVLRQYDPYRCLTVVVPLLVSEDEKTLVTCISSLTKLISRLPPEELMSQLPSFLPSLFDAFGNQSADVRKTVVFCLVDIYIVLGKEFLPYLGSLSSSQLRLVTIYANRISQARSGTPLDPALS